MSRRHASHPRRRRPASWVRLVVDGGMLSVLLVLMGYTFTADLLPAVGNFVHEWGGILLVVLIAVHLWLNIDWWGRLFKGRYDARRMFSAAVVLLLVLSLLATVAAALPISIEVFPGFTFGSESMWPARIHTAAANWMLVLAAVHLGTQWPRVRSHFPRVPRRLVPCVWMLLVAVSLYGAWAAWERNVPQKMIFYYTFDFGREGESLLRFVADYLSIFVLPTVITHVFFRRGKRKPSVFGS